MARGTTVDEFAEKVRAYAAKTVQLIAKDMTAAAFTEVATRIIQMTPVLTGTARSNWLPTVDVPSNEVIEPHEELGNNAAGFTGDLTGAPLTSEEKSKLTQAIDAFRKGNGTKLYLSNNLDYIAKLDAGSSQKAPGGMVDPAIHGALGVLQSKKLSIG